MEGRGLDNSNHNSVQGIQKAFQSIDEDAEHSVIIANARNIATAINAYNSLNPDDLIADNASQDHAKQALNEISIWPSDMSEQEENAAWKLIIIKEGVASLIE